MNLKEYVIIGLACLLHMFSGCTTLGISILSKEPDEEKLFDVKSNNMMFFDSGKEITIITKDGKSIEGKFVSFSRIPCNEYELYYEESRKLLSPKIKLPKYGDEIFFEKISIKVSGNTNVRTILKERKYNFYGFDLGGIVLGDSNCNNTAIIPIHSLESRNKSNTDSFNFDQIKFLLKNGEVPLISKININIDNEQLSILGENITEIKIDSYKTSAILAFMLSIGVDSFILLQGGYAPVGVIAGNIVTLPILLLTIL